MAHRLNGAGGGVPGRTAAVQQFDILDIRSVGRVLRRHLLLATAITMLVTAAAAYLAYTQPLRYLSQATLRMTDTRRALTGSLDAEAAGQLSGRADPLLSQIEVLESRTLLGRTVDRMGLRLQPLDSQDGFTSLSGVEIAPGARPDTFTLRFAQDGVEATDGTRRVRAAYGAPLELGEVRFAVLERPAFGQTRLTLVPRDRAIDRLSSGLRARVRERTDIVDVSYNAGDPAVARRVLDGLVEEFQMMNAQQAQQLSRTRRQFIEEQLRETDAQLREAQLALSAFRTSQQGFSSQEKYTAEQSGLVSLEMRREELEAERQLVRTLLARLERGASQGSLSALVSSPAIASNRVVADLYAQLMRYEEARDSLTTGAYRSAATNPDVQRLETLAASTHRRIVEAVRSQLASLDARVAALDNLLARRQARMQALPGVEAEEVRLANQVATTQTVADQLRTELQRARIAEAVETGQVEVVDPASVPGGPVPTRRPLRIALGLLLGLAMAGGAAVLREQMNTTVQRREELDDVLQLASLAVIPQLTRGISNGRFSRLRGRRRAEPAGSAVDQRLVTAHSAQSAGAEAYRTLRTNLIFSQTTHQLRTVVVTSAGPAEGKTTTSCNLAATMAQQGMKVLLVDCDLRRPQVHAVFAVPREPGLTQLIVGHGNLAEFARPTAVENLFVLPSGTLPPNPSEMLGSQRMREVMEELRGAYDLVVIDTAPVLLAPDAAIMGAGVDGVVLVVRAGLTHRAEVLRSAEQLERVGARIFGAVLNDPDAKMPRESGYYSTVYYGRDE